MTILLWIFKGLLGLKKLATLLLSLLRTPVHFLYRIILLPLFAHGYRGLRYIKKQTFQVLEHIQDRALRILANRYTVNAIIVLLTFIVTTTNIYASDPGQQIENLGQQSVISVALQGGEEQDVVIESAETETLVVNQDVSYLAGQALSAHEFSSDDSFSGSDEGFELYDESDAGHYESPLANAVRVQPELEADAPRTRTKIETHIVQEGETLGAIARMYGVSIQTIMSANNLSGSGLIRPGQSLRILPIDGLMYVVKRGDTLNGIAQKYQSEGSAILHENGLADASSLQIGAEIILPGGRAPAAPRPTPPRTGSVQNLVTPGPAADRVGTGKMLWPTAARRITQYWRGSRHTGVDIAGPTGTAVYAADDGVVTFSGWNRGGYGNMIIVDHGGGLYTRYAHASKNLMSVGDSVKRGDVIQLMGSTGRSTGPHLHFEVMSGSTSRRVNPLDWVN